VLSLNVTQPYVVGWDPKIYDNYLETSEGFRDPVPDVDDDDNPFNTYGEYLICIYANFAQCGEFQNQSTITRPNFIHRSTMQYGFSPDTWYKRHSPLGGETA
jgi:hypothetical protein